MIVALADAEHEHEFGGKARELGRAERAGLPVPPGLGLSVSFVERVVQGDRSAQARLTDAFVALGAPVAVRSSGIGEDSASASFAGQHATVLNVRTRDGLLEAVQHVHQSARTDAALAYRKRLGLSSEPRMGIVVQTLVAADCAGILFTRHPLTGADERVIEGSWGLGESVVAGLVTPDRYRLARGGKLLAHELGDKDLAILWNETGGTHEVPVEPERAARPCLSAAQLERLDALATQCEGAFGGSQDLEWAFAGQSLFLL
ncbi:MAG TPA: PEP/pyruvate-binding domain-containing protein, partial [Polyangiaceae bacterium]